MSVILCPFSHRISLGIQGNVVLINISVSHLGIKVSVIVYVYVCFCQRKNCLERYANAEKSILSFARDPFFHRRWDLLLVGKKMWACYGDSTCIAPPRSMGSWETSSTLGRKHVESLVNLDGKHKELLRRGGGRVFSEYQVLVPFDINYFLSRSKKKGGLLQLWVTRGHLRPVCL